MYTALYRKYRPKTFDEMVGQEHIVKILGSQINTGNYSHAYLFCGTRGTGKTTAARIFAKGVNCLSDEKKPCGVCENCASIQKGVFFDVIEIDAASNNSVENIRELRESVKYPPAAGLCKVYIIDEVHMLSTSAFNALLKTLEEPPEHVIFVLATTEPHKLPPTVLSRCLRLDFKRVPEAKIRGRLKEICEDLDIKYEENALSLIAANGDGSVRDSLSIMEQCLPVPGEALTGESVIEVLGTAGEAAFLEITDYVAAGDTAGALQLIEKMAAEGKDMRQFIKDWTFHFRNLMLSKFEEKLEDVIDMSCENADKVKAQGAELTMAFITAAITELSEAGLKAKDSSVPRTVLELSVLKLSEPAVSKDMESLLQRMAAMEKKLEEGVEVRISSEKASKKAEKAPEESSETKPEQRPEPKAEPVKPINKTESKMKEEAEQRSVEAQNPKPLTKPEPETEPEPAAESHKNPLDNTEPEKNKAEKQDVSQMQLDIDFLLSVGTKETR